MPGRGGTGIQTDYDGITRSLTLPAMGAHEISLTGLVTVYASAGIATADYLTLQDAFDAINAGTQMGTLTITINTNVMETATAALNASRGTASYTSIYIYPVTTGLTISGKLAAPLINLNGADNVTIDGRVSGGACTVCTADLTITNTSNSSTARISTIWFINIHSIML